MLEAYYSSLERGRHKKLPRKNSHFSLFSKGKPEICTFQLFSFCCLKNTVDQWLMDTGDDTESNIYFLLFLSSSSKNCKIKLYIMISLKIFPPKRQDK